MRPSDEETMVLSDAVIFLEDGDRLLICHSAALEPVYIPQGGPAVRKLVASFDGLKRREVLARLPGHVKLFDMLVGHGILVATTGDRSGRGRAKSFAANAGGRKDMAVYLLMSQTCNLGCVYCLNGKRTYRDKPGNMAADVACRAIEKALAQVGDGGRVEVIFFGGEPLLNWEGIKETQQRCENDILPRYPGKNIAYHITSNFTMLPDDFIAWAGQHRVSLLCDIDGPGPVHDRCRPFLDGRPSYGQVAANLGKLTGAGLAVALRSTIIAANVGDMASIASLHRELGGDASLLVPVNPVNSDEEFLTPELLPDVQALLDGMESVYREGVWPEHGIFPFNVCQSRLMPGGGRIFGCAAPYGNIWVVDVAGDVYPCTHALGIPRYLFGNVGDGDFPRPEPLLRMAATLDVDNSQGCKECGWRYLCGGGCAITREMVLMNETAPRAVKDYCQQLHCRFEPRAMELLLWARAEQAGTTAAQRRRTVSRTTCC